MYLVYLYRSCAVHTVRVSGCESQHRRCQSSVTNQRTIASSWTYFESLGRSSREMRSMRKTSQGTLFTTLIICGFACVARSIQALPITAGPYAADDLFPGFHLRPAANWMNDPNGMFYFRGRYHFFCQYNPKGPDWGNMSWFHAVSEDLVQWREIEVALLPDQPYDLGGVFSGSTTIVDGIPTIIYTCLSSTRTSTHTRSAQILTLSPCLCVSSGVAENQWQSQCLARPSNLSDPDLTLWEKSPANPIISAPFGRDPTTAWRTESGDWAFAFGTGAPAFTSGRSVLATLPAGEDFWKGNWTSRAETPLHANNLAQFWECPDIFRAPATAMEGAPHITALKASCNNQDFVSLGRYNSTSQVWVPGCDPSSSDDCNQGALGGAAHLDVYELATRRRWSMVRQQEFL